MTLLDPLAETSDRRRYVPLDTSERTLAALAAHLREGRSPVLLTGPGGIGKTLLLHVLAEREQGPLQRARLSESLPTAPDELPGWLLHFLFRQWAPEDTDAGIALVERLHGLGVERMLLLVDQIHLAPPESVRKLAELARAGMPELAVVVAGTDGEDLRERIASLAPEAMVSMPASLPDEEIGTLYAAILADPDLSPRLRDRLADVERCEILCAAAGLPLLLKKELIRREERTAAPAPQLRRVDPPLATRPAPAAPVLAAAVQAEQRLRRRPPHLRFLRDALHACAYMTIVAEATVLTLLRNAVALAVRAREKVVALARSAVGSISRSSTQLVREGAESVRASISIVQAGIRGPCKRILATAARARLAVRAQLTSAGAHMALLPTRIGTTSRSAGAGIRHTSTALARGAHEGLGRVRLEASTWPGRLQSHRRRVRAWIASMAARNAVRGAAASATALFVISLLYLGRPEVAVPKIPAVSASVLERHAPPAATPSGVASPASLSVVNVQVNARPWALVRIDGRDLGPTPLSRRLAPGVYELEASFPDGRTIRRNIEVSRERRFVSLP